MSPAPAPCAVLQPRLDAYLLDLFAAARHHPALDGTLLTARAHADAEALARAFRVLGGDSVGVGLVVQEAKMDYETAVVGASSVDGASWADGRSAAWVSAESVTQGPRANGHGNGSVNGLTPGKEPGEFRFGEVAAGVQVRVAAEDGAYEVLLPGGREDMEKAEVTPADALQAALEKAWPEVWDVSEEDVARIFPRAVSHRLRARDGPDDEVLGSVMWPAVPLDSGGIGVDAGSEAGGEVARIGWERKGVKEILVRILADV